MVRGGNIEFIGNDFVGQSLDKVLQDLTFSFGQQANFLYGGLLQGGSVPKFRPLQNCPSHILDQQLIVEWLFHKIDCTGPHRADSEWYIAMARDDDDKNTDSAF